MWDLLNTEFREADSIGNEEILTKASKSFLYRINASWCATVHYSEEYGY